MKIGILGYGSIGQRHGASAMKLGHYGEVYDPLTWHIDRRGHILTWADAIIVASPTEFHVQDLHDALEAKKHVLVEKPIGYDDPNIVHNLLYHAAVNKLIVATGFNLRFHSCVQAAKNVLDRGLLGNIICASFTVNQLSAKPPYLRDGVIRNWLSHEIDLAHFLLGDGEVETCVAPIDEFGHDSKEAFIAMKFPEVRDKVYVQGDYYTEPQQRFWWIEGDHSSLYCNMIRREIYMRFPGEQPNLFYRGEDSFDANYVDEMRAFTDLIATGFPNPWLATGEDGVRSLRTVMAARLKAGLDKE